MPPKKAKKPVSKETKETKETKEKKPTKKQNSNKKKLQSRESDEEDTPLSETEYIGGDNDDLDKQDDVGEPADVGEVYEEIDEDDLLDGNGLEIENEDEEQEDDRDDLDIEEKENVDDEDECIYRFTKKKSEFLVDEDIDEEYFSEEEAFIPENEIYVEKSQRITRDVMTKYERVRVLADRTKQLALGAKAMIKGVGNMNPKEVAKLELKEGVMPLIIIRKLPSGKKEKWKVSELKVVN